MSPRFSRTLSVLALVCAGRAVAQQAPAAATPTPTPVPTPRARRTSSCRRSAARRRRPSRRPTSTGRRSSRRAWGQELPVLLQDTPSVTQYSETGSGQGYAYFTLRGLSATRVNMTFDGVPLNEPEDSAVYTADFGNLALNLASVQVQRGVGTSTFGAAAFAGSLNFESLDATRAPGLTASLAAGSFGTAQASADWNSGTFGGGWRLSLRPSWQTTDGFREHSGVKQDSLYFTAVRDFASSSLRISGFVGEESIQQAFYAVEPQILETNLASNPMSPDEKDHFHEYLATAQWTLALGDDGSLSLQPYVVGAGGWYRLFADETTFTDLQEYGLSWLFGGGIATVTQKLGALRLTLGAHANAYKSTHTLDDGDGARLYTNHGTKSEISGFLKLLGDLGRWHPFLDAQVRHARFGYEGDVGDTSMGWTFFNPKAGVRLDLSPRIERVPLRGPHGARAREERPPLRRGQRVGAAGPRRREARDRLGRRARRRVADADAFGGQPVRHGVPRRDRGDGGALRDRPAAPEERGQELPPRDRARGGWQALDALRLTATRTRAATGSPPGRSSTTCTTRTATTRARRAGRSTTSSPSRRRRSRRRSAPRRRRSAA